METIDKKTTKEEVQETENHHLRIILKSQEVKNLEFVSSTIVSLAKQNTFKVNGPKYMPNKILKITTRRSPCGNGTNTYDKFEMRVHTRVIDIWCPYQSITDITNFKIKPGVDIQIQYFRDEQ